MALIAHRYQRGALRPIERLSLDQTAVAYTSETRVQKRSSPVQRYGRCVKVFVGDGRPLQHLGMMLMHTQFGPLLSQPHIGRSYSERYCIK